MSKPATVTQPTEPNNDFSGIAGSFSTPPIFTPRADTKPTLKNVALLVQPELLDQLKTAAKAYGLSTNAFVIQAIEFSLQHLQPTGE